MDCFAIDRNNEVHKIHGMHRLTSEFKVSFYLLLYTEKFYVTYYLVVMIIYPIFKFKLNQVKQIFRQTVYIYAMK